MPDSVPEDTLIWLAERLINPKVVMRCRCGHDISDHGWSDITDDEPTSRPWPCTFPKGYGAPHTLCHCEDYTEPDLDWVP